ncbi:hypothetical protein Ddye_012389 [Dipteronia dyeriana]|uniref:HAT C-terminal dimerisation domain-containing protein n=1 Tax=Dipteronia dyeriana TaxID=168575 RepID=A0AAD9X483_9ROSI|nr:hypothetical protein Ddye_012389 [Dipteronia dyeriana]
MPPPSDEFDADEEEKPLKSDLFRVHMKKFELDDGTIKIMCNYCPKTYKAVKSFGYGTYWNHVKRNHPSELVKASNQGQISRAKKLRASSSSSNTHSELDRILEANHVFLEDKFSILSWWKDYEQEYPILAIIAKQILGTPVSTVAVEQEFSAGRNILDPRRNRTENRRFRNRPKPSYSGYGYGYGSCSAFPRNRNRRFETETEPKPNRGHHYLTSNHHHPKLNPTSISRKSNPATSYHRKSNPVASHHRKSTTTKSNHANLVVELKPSHPRHLRTLATNPPRILVETTKSAQIEGD